jgi:CPA1 family monovalent cation:H+ antiporter
MTFVFLFAAASAYFNERFFKLPDTIGMVLTAILVAIACLVLESMHIVHIRPLAEELINEINFSETVLHGMIAFLLFSGSLNVRTADLHEQRGLIAALAVGSTVLGALLVGTFVYYMLTFFGINITYIECLIFGALISPTDPIACLGIFKKLGMPARLQVLVEGESLFNDGMGVVVFLVVMEIASGGGEASAEHALGLFGQQALGGIAVGTLCALIAFFVLTGVERTSSQALMTLGLVAGNFLLAEHLEVSGLIATVAAGLIIGNYARDMVMSASRHHLDAFWEVIDEVLNAILFLFVGAHLLMVPFNGNYLFAAVLAIPLALLGRMLSVAVPVNLLRVGPRFKASRQAIIVILTWGGLRGGLSLAMCLSLPAGPTKDLFLMMTFFVVVFSIVVQGLTVGKIYTPEQLKEFAANAK